MPTKTSLPLPSISLPPSQPPCDSQAKPSLLLFIPGNPGLVDYYTPFLTHLHTLLPATHIHGQNLLGFSDTDHTPPFSTTNPPFLVEDQIAHLQSTITTLAPDFSSIILVGHSVGAYIALELFHRHHVSPVKGVDLKAGICLFPAIAHLASSSSGQKLAIVKNNTLLDGWLHRAAKAFVDLIPGFLLGRLVRWVTGFPEHAALVTERFVRSRDGIWQGIHMGKDELGVIKEERWREDLWEGVKDQKRFWFLFARTDHWVADEVRDGFVKRRGDRVGVEVDEGELVHAFCIHHSEVVAEKVGKWVGEALGL